MASISPEILVSLYLKKKEAVSGVHIKIHWILCITVDEVEKASVLVNGVDTVVVTISRVDVTTAVCGDATWIE